MIIDCVGCLHGFLPKLDGGDLLIITGDLTANDLEDQYFHVFDWIEAQKYRKKVMIAGNHDGLMEQERYSGPVGLVKDAFDYLCDSGTEFEGLKIWGSPWTMTFPGINPKCTAFAVETEKELSDKWALIPRNTDILITHSPPFKIQDKTVKENHVGSISLRDKGHRSNVVLHAFSHVHEDYGKCLGHIRISIKQKIRQLLYVNCSIMNERYQPVNAPIRVVLGDKDLPKSR